MPSPAWLGVAEPQCPTRPEDELVFGSYLQIVGDLRDMGCGHIRRCKYRDVYWGSVFPLGYDADDPDAEYTFQNGEKVPAPNEILANLRAGDYDRLAAFSELLTACRLAGIKMSITPFDAGGGADNTVGAEKGKLEAKDFHKPLADGTWVDLLEEVPAWQQEIRVPSTEGWDDFYWNHGDAEPLERHFQQYAIQVWPTQASDWADSTEYIRECARRKSLGIAAFCQGIAEHLAALHEAWGQALGDEGIYEVVDRVELGNEMNGGYALPDEAADDVVEAGEREAGRYMTLIAAPFRHLLPAMKFRAPELVSWAPNVASGPCEPVGCCIQENFDKSLVWLRDVIGTGMFYGLATDKTNQAYIAASIQSRGTYVAPEEARLWALSCLAAGYWWPPLVDDPSEQLSVPVTDLVHEVGLHWYHGYNTKEGGQQFTPLYQDARRLQYETDRLDGVVVDALRAERFNLSRSAGEVAFPAVFPAAGSTEIDAPYYDGTNPCLQAGMLARYLLTFRAAGLSRTYWFCPILNALTLNDDGNIATWGSKAAGTGLHNDVAGRAEYDHFARLGGWRRPAWFTFRRVSWLLSLVKHHGAVVHNERGVTVLRFELKSRLTLESFTERAGVGRGFRYLWVAWLDQYADDECLHAAHPMADPLIGSDSFWMVLWDAKARGYELVPLVPDLDESATPGERDANGYRQVTLRDWDWAGWDAALTDHREELNDTPGSSSLWFNFTKASPDSAPAPIAFLTDADNAEVFMP